MIRPRPARPQWLSTLFGNPQPSNARLRRDTRALEQLEPRMMLAADFAHGELPDAPHPLFAPGTSAEYISQIDQSHHHGHHHHHDGCCCADCAALAGQGANDAHLAEFHATDRWGGTATDGGGLGWGDATTITWSVAPDGTSIPGFVGEAEAGSNFISLMSSIYGSVAGGVSDQPWFSIVASAFDRWSEVSGLNFVYEPNDDGAAFSNFASSAPGQAGVRGDIRIGGHTIDGNSGTLAYNFFPDNGEMVIDTADAFFTDTSNNSLRLRNVIAHELGHGVGLSHVAPTNQTKLLEPIATTAFDGPQHDDILAAHRLYGDEHETGAGNDSFATAVDVGVLNAASLSIGNHSTQQYVSIDGASDTDYFRFTAAAGATLDAQLNPLGFTYQQGVDAASVSSFDSQAQNNLVLEIYDAQRQLVARADGGGLGASESLGDLRLAGGEYFVRIAGDRDAAQFYRLDLTVSAGVSPGATAEAVGGVIDFGSYSIDSYGGSQDHSGTAAVGDNGAALHLTGNIWKKIDFAYAITPDSVLEFDFASSSQGEIHGIGFDSNTSISSGLTFRLFGSQDWGIDDFDVYDGSGGAQRFVIPVGQFYTGVASSLVFVTDHDVSSPNAESIFSNVRVYEGDGSTTIAAPQAVDDRITVNEDSPTVAFDPLANDDDGGAAVSVTQVSRASAGGTVSVAADGRIHYRPAADFHGTETFTYTLGSLGGTSTATVAVTVRPVNDLPLAGNNSYTVTGGKSYHLYVLNNDSSGADAGETLKIVSVGVGSAGGRIVSDGSRLTYTPASGFAGTETFTYTINDGTPGSNATATVTVRVRPAESDFVDFRGHRIVSYGGNQDGVGAALVENGGRSVRLLGNAWKRIDLPYTITPDTVIEFDFASSSQGEIHGIGLDNNNTITSSRTFRLHGTQNWGIDDFATYATNSGSKHYVIPVGRYYTGRAAYLFFVNDHDVFSPSAESLFSNIRIYEARRSTAPLTAPASDPITTVALQQLFLQAADGRFGASVGGSGSSRVAPTRSHTTSNHAGPSNATALGLPGVADQLSGPIKQTVARRPSAIVSTSFVALGSDRLAALDQLFTLLGRD